MNEQSCGWGERRFRQIHNTDLYLKRVGETLKMSSFAILTHDMPHHKEHPLEGCYEGVDGCFICTTGHKEPDLAKYRGLR